MMYPARAADRVPSFSTENENREESGRQSLTKLVGVTHNVFREFLSPGALGVNTYNPGVLNPNRILFQVNRILHTSLLLY